MQRYVEGVPAVALRSIRAKQCVLPLARTFHENHPGGHENSNAAAIPAAIRGTHDPLFARASGIAVECGARPAQAAAAESWPHTIKREGSTVTVYQPQAISWHDRKRLTARDQLSPREQARALRSQCGGDFQKFCSDVHPAAAAQPPACAHMPPI
jgi:hypothetical protein